MSRVREHERARREALQQELRREDEIVREEPEVDEAAEQGPEEPDTPLGVPAHDDERPDVELPGFPQDDPSHG